jgi:hypothetical protein
MPPNCADRDCFASADVRLSALRLGQGYDQESSGEGLGINCRQDKFYVPIRLG